MNGQVNELSYNGILFGNKKKWSIDTCFNMNELGNIMLSELENQSQETYIVYSSYMKCPDSQIYKTEGKFNDCLRAEGFGRNRGGVIA